MKNCPKNSINTETDFLVIGSGLAGLVFALEAAGNGSVTILVKAEAGVTNTAFAQGGIAAVLSGPDSFESHISDTLVAGCGLNNLKAVELLVLEAPAAIQYLQNKGVHFCQNYLEPDLHLEGGHSHPRIAHVHDHIGSSLQQTLLKAVLAHPNIRLLEHRFAIDLVLAEEGNGRKVCTGVTFLNTCTNGPETYAARAVLLATGGLGQVYDRTTNPAVATADGLAMAARAGAQVKDLEFVQFHPTALYSPGHEPVFLISEAVRGAGAVLRNAQGEEFMVNKHPQGSLAPRDIVARKIAEEMHRSGTPFVYLDLSPISAQQIPQLFPTIYQTCLSRGIDCTRQPIPVSPAAHYACGGVVTDVWGQTSVPRLFAAGEVACTGVHGANRLASNSLLEAVVFARRAAAKAAELEKEKQPELPPQTGQKWPMPSAIPEQTILEIKAALQKQMSQKAGIVRQPEKLMDLQQWLHQIQQIPFLKQPDLCNHQLMELRNLLEVAGLIVKAALARKTNIGGHCLIHSEISSHGSRKASLNCATNSAIPI